MRKECPYSTRYTSLVLVEHKYIIYPFLLLLYVSSIPRQRQKSLPLDVAADLIDSCRQLMHLIFVIFDQKKLTYLKPAV